MMTAWFGLIVLGAVVGEGTELTLEWTAPAPCPAAAEVRRSVEATLGRSLAPRSSPLLALSAEVRSEVRADGPSRFEANVVIQSGAGTADRRLEARTCPALVEAVALIVALALDQASDAQDGAGSLLAAERNRRAVRAVLRAPRRDDQISSAWRPYFAAGLLGGVGGLPRPSAGVSVRGGAARGRWRADLGATVRLPRRTNFSGAQGGFFSVYAGAARGCFRAVAAWPSLDVCLGGEVGLLQVDGAGADENDRQSQVWIAGWAEGAAAVPVSETLSVVGRVRLLTPFRRPSYGFEDEQERFRVSPVVGDAILELTYTFQ